MIRIRLLGAIQCQANNEPVVQQYAPRIQQFLAYLLLYRNKPQPRRQVAALFWPDTNEAQARTNLRNLLKQFRAVLPEADQFLHNDGQSLCWRMSPDIALDLVEFDELLDAAESSPFQHKRAALESAIQIYTGELAAGHYNEWLIPEREYYQQRYQQALEELSSLQEAMQEPYTALATAQRLLHSDPLREATYMRLMRLHALCGDRGAALRTYQHCATILVNELGVEPSAETQALYDRLLKRDEIASLPTADTTIPLVGRVNEWLSLQGSWHTVRQGQPFCTLLRGEAGIGKTRLAEQLLGWVGQQGFPAAIAHCYEAAGDLPLAPVVAWLRNSAFQPAIQNLEVPRRADLGRLMPELFPQPMQVPTLVGSDAWQRRRLFEALAAIVVGSGQATLLVLDDIQWCDADTLDWLQFLIHSQPDAPVLLVLTLRDEDLEPHHPFHQLLTYLQRLGIVGSIALQRLAKDETAVLASRLLGHALNANELEQLAQETEGNPLFVVETLRSQITGAAPAALARMQSVINLRLQRLSESARALVNVAAVIGRAFSSDTLLYASQMPEERFSSTLDELWQRTILRTEDANHYDFSHDKIRSGVLEHLSPPTRRLLHQRVARALIATTAYDLDSVSAQVASHFDQGGSNTEAIQYYQRAAQVAQRLGALAESIVALRRALTLLEQQPVTSEREATERTIQLALFPLLLARYGYSAPEVERTLRRAYTLCQYANQPALLFRVLWGLGRFYLVLPNLDAGVEIGEQMLALAHTHTSHHFLLEAHNSLGALHFHRGAFVAAKDHFDAALAIYAPTTHGDHALIYGQDPGIVSHTRLAWTLWFLEQHDAALAQGEQAALLIEQSTHLFSKTFGLAYLAHLAQFAGDTIRAYAYAAPASQLAQTYGFPLLQGMSDQILGWVQIQQGQLEAGQAALETGLELFRSTGAMLGIPYYAYLHADAARICGDTQRARQLLKEGIEVMERTGEYWSAPLLQHVHHQLP